MDYMMSAADIMNVLGEEIPVISSAELYKYKSIDDIFQGSDKVLLLYQTDNVGRQRIGHWTGLIRNKDGISFYDPYGTWPDDQYNNIPFKYRKETNQTKKFLSNLMYKSRYPLHYSPHTHQVDAEGINTCGRHVATFLKIGLEPEKYHEFMSIVCKKKNKNPDQIVVDFTNNFL